MVDGPTITQDARERLRGRTLAAGWFLLSGLDAIKLAHEEAKRTCLVVGEHDCSQEAEALPYAIQMLTSPHADDVRAVKTLADDMMNAGRQLWPGSRSEAPTGDIEAGLRRVNAAIQVLESELAALHVDAMAVGPDAVLGPHGTPAPMLAALTDPQATLRDALCILRTAIVAADPESA